MKPSSTERKKCSIDGCTAPAIAHGWCDGHYRRWKRHGDPLAGRAGWKADSAVERFWARVERKQDGCWLWTGSLMTPGYGVLCVNGKSTGAHRFAYELLVGPIPGGLVLDHLCRNRACVNPARLEPVTQGENVRRGGTGQSARARQLAKTHCKHGHPLSGDNVHIGKRGSRVCRACRRDQLARYRADGRISQQTRAQSRAQAAVRRGDLTKEPCEVCGETEVQAHHDDYDKPLDVRWLCRGHHNLLHHSKAARAARLAVA